MSAIGWAFTASSGTRFARCRTPWATRRPSPWSLFPVSPSLASCRDSGSSGLGRLAETTQPHPGLVGVDTIRLTGVEQTTDRIVAVAGFKWNVANTWLLTANVRRPLTVVGLNAGWVPTITFDYSFGR